MVVNLVWSMKTRYLFENHGQFQPTTMIFTMHSTEFCVRIIVFIHLVKVNSLRRLRSILTAWSNISTTLIIGFVNQYTAIMLLLLLSVSIVHVIPQPFTARQNNLVTCVVIITFAFHILRLILVPRPSGPWRTRAPRFLYARSSRRAVASHRKNGKPRQRHKGWLSPQ